jgi:hypothetical protein
MALAKRRKTTSDNAGRMIVIKTAVSTLRIARQAREGGSAGPVRKLLLLLIRHVEACPAIRV